MTVAMRTLLLTLAALATTASSASAAEPPYAKLANELGTPQLADSAGPADKSRLALVFVRAGENARAWTKRTSIAITKVDAAQNDRDTASVIASLRAELAKRHAHVDAFEVRSRPPVSAYFAYHVGTQRDRGIAYSPATGFVTIADLAEGARTTIVPDDVATLKKILGR